MNLELERSGTSTAGIFTAHEASAETVSEFFRSRSVTTTLPQWDHHSLSQVSSYTNVPANSTPDDISSSALKNDREGGQSGSVHSSDQYDSYPGSGNGDDQISFPITPPVSDRGQLGLERKHSLDDTEGESPSRKKRNPVPEEKKDNKYYQRRKKNNEAAKRSRDIRKKRVEEEIKSAKDAVTENQKLKQEIDVLKAEINSLRRLLKDANMTLSLWIRARQASEPNTQLPPMLRGSNLSFVNFPVTTNI